MKYTKHFSFVNKNVGLQRLSVDQLARLFNIVYLEGKINGFDNCARLYKDFDHGQGTLSKFRLQKQLTELTGNIDPKDLMKQMYRFSQN